GVVHWVSFAFVPARLLFLLPFWVLLITRRAWIAVVLAGLSVVSLVSYFRQENFLNKGYLLPFDRIADIIQQRTGGRPAQLEVQAPGLDVSPLTRRLRIASAARPEVIWVLSNRDEVLPPAGTDLVRRDQFVPYSKLDHAMIKLLGWPVLPSHVL